MESSTLPRLTLVVDGEIHPSRFSPCPPFISLPTSFSATLSPPPLHPVIVGRASPASALPLTLPLPPSPQTRAGGFFFCRHYPRLSTLWTCSHMPQRPLTCPMPSPHHQDTDRSWGQRRYVTTTGCSLTLTDAHPHPHPPFNALVHLLNHAPQTLTPSTLPTTSLPRFSPLPRLALPPSGHFLARTHFHEKGVVCLPILF